MSQSDALVWYGSLIMKRLTSGFPWHEQEEVVNETLNHSVTKFFKGNV